jgi:hypothetical protein
VTFTPAVRERMNLLLRAVDYLEVTDDGVAYPHQG